MIAPGRAARAPRSPPSASRAWLRALETTARLTAASDATLAALLDTLAEAHGDAPALLSEREVFSFQEMAAQARRYTRWARIQGLGRGDVVALLAPNSPDYFIAWAGVTRTGASVALLNANLREAPLVHAVRTARPTHLLVAPELLGVFEDAAGQLDFRPKIWMQDRPLGDGECGDSEPNDSKPTNSGPGDIRPSDGVQRLSITAYRADPLDEAERSGAGLSDRALLIYTSGTTGLPKAANVSHRRVLSWCGWFAGMMDTGPADRMYDCLPMYHSVGGVAAIGAVLVNGGSVFIRERFSASQFWSDVVRWDCTLFQYIGELCRYLLAAPPHADETRHRLRLACGNGLREEVWTAFQARFAIPGVLEFYAATEGAFSLYNVEGRPGSIGRVPPFLAHRFPAAIVRHDLENGQPARDAAGRCLACGPDEVGEAIGRLASRGSAPGVESRSQAGAGRFEGYSDAAETQRKVLRNVFEYGDAWFRTGDLMRRDAAGFFYFVDRVGDSFRWKGENVSAAEVADVIAATPGVIAAVVYGVAVSGADGRAGMAALVVDAGFDLADLRRQTARLPRYARPLFVRLAERLATTETFKPKTQALIREAYDPTRVSDALYVDDARLDAYVPLTPDVYAAIQGGRIRF